MSLDVTRREFLKSTAAISAYTLVVGFTPGRVLASGSMPEAAHLTPFIRISSDGAVTAIIKHFECGQGTVTGLATLIAEELGVNLDDVSTEFAPHDTERYKNLVFGMQATGGSSSLPNSYMQYRQAGAAARDMLLQAAAQTWQVSASELTLAEGKITGHGHSAPLSEFVGLAATMDVPVEPVLKSPEDFVLIGNPAVPRLDNHSKVTGEAQYSMDMQLDNQLVAVILRSPKFGGTVVSVDTSAASNVSGFVKAIVLPAQQAVVVYGKDTWAAFQARKVIGVEWDFSSAETRSSDQIKAELLSKVNDEPHMIAKGNSTDSQALFSNAHQVVEHDFFLPYLAHAPMEPMTCTIEPTENGIVVHDGCQAPTAVHGVMAAVLKLPPDQIKINTLYAGGSFGRRFTISSDYHVEAALAFALNGAQQPVKLVWSREDDLAGGYYRPAAAHKVRVALDAEGNIVAWDHRVATQSLFKGTPLESFIVRDGIDWSSIEGIADTPYSLEGMVVGLTDSVSPVPVNWWRSVGHSHTAFVMESMMDVAARAAGQDPVAYRLKLLSGDDADQQRLANVLRLAAEKAGWDTALPAGHSRGVAVHKSFGSYVAQVVEISRQDTGRVKIEKVTCAVDCGVPVNPDVIEAQMESGIGYGIGHVMRNQITLKDGVVVETNFPTYQPLRISDIGQIDTHIVPSEQAPSGVGEPGTPPAGPALANAISVDGPRVTFLPMSANGVTFG